MLLNNVLLPDSQILTVLVNGTNGEPILLSILFDDQFRHFAATHRETAFGERRPRVDYKALCFNLRHEVYVLSIAAEKMKKGEQFSDDDWTTLDRVIQSFERLPNVR